MEGTLSEPPFGVLGIVELQALCLLPFGKVTEEFKPHLVLRGKGVQLGWEASGRRFTVDLPETEYLCLLENSEEPFLLEMIVMPDSTLERYFKDQCVVAHSSLTRIIIQKVVAIQKAIGTKTARWSDWVKNQEGYSPGKDHASNKAFAVDFKKILDDCDRLTPLTAFRLARPVPRPMPRRVPSHLFRASANSSLPARLQSGLYRTVPMMERGEALACQRYRRASFGLAIGQSSYTAEIHSTGEREIVLKKAAKVLQEAAAIVLDMI